MSGVRAMSTVIIVMDYSLASTSSLCQVAGWSHATKVPHIYFHPSLRVEWWRFGLVGNVVGRISEVLSQRRLAQLSR